MIANNNKNFMLQEDFNNPKTLKFQKENTLESSPTLYPNFFELVNFFTAFGHGGFPGSSVVKNLFAMQETQVWSLGWENPLEKEMATHSSILVWETPWSEEPGRL